MVKCPYCGKAAMSPGQKSALGPGRVVACQSCGKKVAAHWTAILAAVPAFLGGYVFLNSESALVGFAAVAGGVLLMATLHTFVVPLMRSN
jgi:endogenous inhibitor of DNA gyrase (YacG/DUF329 family)